ncbi:aldehyde dehydrogenase family protein [candidate division CSSED10-310 bacterium]|uniref:Aldehyde dehydrogenase n=1 Tax=candidate division CSSED10-310 bacterium TaxID=2855610 RepID=A0ABV6YZV9_UNCC1
MTDKILANQKKFFQSRETRAFTNRCQALENLKRMIVEKEELFLNALQSDLGKPPLEAYSSELGILVNEIDYTKRHLRNWMKPRRVRTPLFLKPGGSSIVPEPLGSVLILGPWNYPVQLILAPLIGAIAAGNTAVLKPSENSPQSAKALTEALTNYFDPEFIAVCNGDSQVSVELVQQPFDHIFFTGNPVIGRKVMKAASRNLVPVTLELGGKSPCIIWNDADIDVTCRRVLWGKFLNAGQTCVAPDYVLVHTQIRARFLERCKETLREFYGPSPRESKDYSRIINVDHFDRLVNLMNQGEILYGGENDRSELYIQPTLMHEVPLVSPLMSDEIFGPILPVIPVENLAEVLSFLQQRPKPLTIYLFTNNSTVEQAILEQVSSGSVCINDTIGQIMGSYLPFGGVGQSGMGRYRGKASFDCFSNYKSVLKRSLTFDFRPKYPPYSISLGAMRIIMKMFF